MTINKELSLFFYNPDTNTFPEIDDLSFKKIEILLQNGANPNYEFGEEGNYNARWESTNLLSMAIERQDPKLVKLLLDYGADVNQFNNASST